MPEQHPTPSLPPRRRQAGDERAAVPHGTPSAATSPLRAAQARPDATHAQRPGRMRSGRLVARGALRCLVSGSGLRSMPPSVTTARKEAGRPGMAEGGDPRRRGTAHRLTARPAEVRDVRRGPVAAQPPPSTWPATSTRTSAVTAPTTASAPSLSGWPSNVPRSTTVCGTTARTWPSSARHRTTSLEPRANAVRAVGVATGSSTADDLHAAGAAAVLSDLTDTGTVLRAVLGA